MSRLLTIGNFLQGDLGLTRAQAAGVLGNFKRETGQDLATSRNEGGGMGLPTGRGGYGLAQWTRSRQQDLIRFAGSPEKAADLNTQLQFLKHELTGSERRALDSLRKAQTPEEAAFVFDRDFERSGVKAIPERQAFARQAYATLAGGGSPAASSGAGPAPALAATGGTPAVDFTAQLLAGLGGTANAFTPAPMAAARPAPRDANQLAGQMLETSFAEAAGFAPGGHRMAASAGLMPRLSQAAFGRSPSQVDELLKASLSMAGSTGSAMLAVPAMPGMGGMGSAAGGSPAGMVQSTSGDDPMVDIVTVGRKLEKAGLRVREHPAFGGVGKHSEGSLHYSNKAVDVTDWQDPGESQASWGPRKAHLEKQFAQILGSSGQIYGPSSDPAGHGTHIHLGLPGGQIPLSKAQALVQARMEALQKYPLRWAG